MYETSFHPYLRPVFIITCFHSYTYEISFHSCNNDTSLKFGFLSIPVFLGWRLLKKGTKNKVGFRHLKLPDFKIIIIIIIISRYSRFLYVAKILIFKK
jgi:hypothetical protein